MNVILKRTLITIPIICAVSFVLLMFIPAAIPVQNKAIFYCNTAAASRMINYQWKQMFEEHTDSSFRIGEFNYHIQKPVYNGANIHISINGKTYLSTLSLIPLPSDTTLLQWNLVVETSKNPFEKFHDYLQSQALQLNMEKAILQMQIFLQNPRNVYHYRITKTTLTDTVLTFTKKLSGTYPDTNEIYEMVNKLKSYISDQNAKETNSPMLNIIHTDSGYLSMVGIPTNKELPETKDITNRYLRPMKNKILTTTVRGGTKSVQDAYEQVEQYMRDHSMSAPVMPFELLITDRSKLSDTSKWITQIFYPII